MASAPLGLSWLSTRSSARRRRLARQSCRSTSTATCAAALGTVQSSTQRGRSAPTRANTRAARTVQLARGVRHLATVAARILRATAPRVAAVAAAASMPRLARVRRRSPFSSTATSSPPARTSRRMRTARTRRARRRHTSQSCRRSCRHAPPAQCTLLRGARPGRCGGVPRHSTTSCVSRAPTRRRG